jgi:glutamate racemase
VIAEPAAETGTSSQDALSRPVGVFDSGVGGLSVLREIRTLLPHEHLLYVADSAHAPYGDKPPEYVEARSLALARFLIAQGAKVLVIACNTATAIGATAVRATYSLPVVAMEPAVKPAAAATTTGVVGVLTTVGSAASARFAALLARFGENVEVITTPAPGLVEHIEQGDLAGAEIRALAERYVQPMVAAGADTIVLGSTHYVFLRPLIADIVGPAVTLVDTGAAVARQLQRVLSERNLLNREPSRGAERFWTSSTDAGAATVIGRLHGQPVEVHVLPREVM